MANERLISAIEQMECALSRIETALSRTRSDRAEMPKELVALTERHEALKNDMAEAIGRIDVLLEGHH